MPFDILKTSVYVIKLNKLSLNFDRLILTLSIALFMRCQIVGCCVNGELYGCKMKLLWPIST